MEGPKGPYPEKMAVRVTTVLEGGTVHPQMSAKFLET